MEQNQNQPTPEQAFNTINSAVRQLKLSADEHDILRSCLQVIANLISPKADEKPSKPKLKVVDAESD